MATLTKRMLLDGGACASAVRKFARLWPHGMRITPNNIGIAVMNDLDIQTGLAILDGTNLSDWTSPGPAVDFEDRIPPNLRDEDEEQEDIGEAAIAVASAYNWLEE